MPFQHNMLEQMEAAIRDLTISVRLHYEYCLKQNFTEEQALMLSIAFQRDMLPKNEN